MFLLPNLHESIWIQWVSRLVPREDVECRVTSGSSTGGKWMACPVWMSCGLAETRRFARQHWCPEISNDSYIWFIFYSYLIHMIFIWYSYDTHMIFIWFSYDIHMIFIWYSYVMVFMHTVTNVTNPQLFFIWIKVAFLWNRPRPRKVDLDGADCDAARASLGDGKTNSEKTWVVSWEGHQFQSHEHITGVYLFFEVAAPMNEVFLWIVPGWHYLSAWGVLPAPRSKWCTELEHSNSATLHS